jgi:C-terminal processing protease CtpA/Prc
LTGRRSRQQRQKGAERPGASYTEIASALKKLGDKYTRFVKPSNFAKLTKYDVTGVGVRIVEKDLRLVSVIQYSLLILKYQTLGTTISNRGLTCLGVLSSEL